MVVQRKVVRIPWQMIQEREDGIFSRVQRSMAYDQLPAAELRLTLARENGDDEGIARATQTLNRLRDEIDA
jgi:hypothetical protein